jgi:3-deoxy-7-phosphoheptulonate synthase
VSAVLTSPAQAGGDLQPPPAPARAAEQQPQWADHPAYRRVCRALASAEPLVGYDEVRSLRRAMAVVAAGDALLIQAGDCAESLHECTRAHTFGKLAVLGRLGDRLGELTGHVVLRVGRIGGQFAKPRSHQVEQHAGRTIPAFRGHLVNSEVPTAAARQPDPRRMLWAYEASTKVLRWTAEYREHAQAGGPGPTGPRGPWASHEALIMDYESRFDRADPGTGERYLASTHLPWIGVRTNGPDSGPVRLLARTGNPVGCKVGPGTEPARLLRLCAVLDPHREPGRLVLIARLGRAQVDTGLYPLVRAVRNAGHPVVWLCDPMHGNTVRTASGLKTRHLDDMIYEAVSFRRIVGQLGEHPGGLHLEVASEPVTECVDGSAVGPADVPRNYTSLCDPRLNPEQAQLLVERWAR